MKAEIISFSPGHELMTIIMSDCEKNGITQTDWVLQKVYAAIDKNNERTELAYIRRSISIARRQLRWEGNTEHCLEILDQAYDSLTIILKR